MEISHINIKKTVEKGVNYSEFQINMALISQIYSCIHMAYKYWHDMQNEGNKTQINCFMLIV